MTAFSRCSLFVAVFLHAVACSREPSPAETRAASASAAARKLPPAAVLGASSRAALPALVPREIARDAACRIVTLKGELTLASFPLAEGALLRGEDWLALAAGASVALKHTTSAREFRVDGPATFRACRKGRERILLARGVVHTTPGAGVRPGAEVAIATPGALVRYADAELTLTLDAKALLLEVRSGAADVEETKRPREVSKVSGKQRARFELGQPAPEELLNACQSAAEVAERSARFVTAASTEPLAERARAHVRARKAARTACSIAAAATGLVADAALQQRLWAGVERWEGLWETAPRRLDPVQPH